MMNNIKVFNKDGLEFLSEIPDNSIDLILTDPPYITSRETGMNKWVDHVAKQDAGSADIKTEEQWLKHKTPEQWEAWFEAGGVPEAKRKRKLKELKHNYIKYGSIYGKKYAVKTDYGEWDSEFTMEQLQLFVNHFHRILRTGGTCIVFFDLWKLSYLKEQMESVKFKQLRFIEWVKTNPQPVNSSVNYLTNCREIALLAIKKSKPTFNSKYDKGIYNYPICGGKDRFHPTQKSLPLFEDLVKKHSNEGDIVLDCFLGSGTTAVAAVNTNRRFIGCEADEAYYTKSLAIIDRYVATVAKTEADVNEGASV
jgi:site-specific DNA-methyltransferase (adenine-specific)